MEIQSRLDNLLELADQLGISIRREPLGGDGGGLCTLRGRRVLFVDTMADLDTRYERALAGLAPLQELDKLYIRPEIRQDLDAYRKRSL